MPRHWHEIPRGHELTGDERQYVVERVVCRIDHRQLCRAPAPPRPPDRQRVGSSIFSSPSW